MQTDSRYKYISKVATNVEEAQSLIESGFEYVTDMRTGGMSYRLFRKRKQWKLN